MHIELHLYIYIYKCCTNISSYIHVDTLKGTSLATYHLTFGNSAINPFCPFPPLGDIFCLLLWTVHVEGGEATWSHGPLGEETKA